MVQGPGLQEGDRFSPHVDSQGAIALPEDYRAGWAHMGTVVIPTDRTTGFHDVYTRQSTIEAYRRTGEFPNGAAPVKEVRNREPARLTTGEAIWADEIDHWFAMIKDDVGRFPESPTWREGWGWVPCHPPARADDWVYVDSLPTLRRPKPIR